MKTINSRVNWVNWAPNKVTKKDVPRLVSLIARTSTIQNSKFYIGFFVRIVKKDKAFRKSYKQSFTDEVFELTGIPTINPPTYSLVDADNEPNQRKFYQPELQLVRLLLVEIVQQPVWRQIYSSSCFNGFNRSIWFKHTCIKSEFFSMTEFNLKVIGRR